MTDIPGDTTTGVVVGVGTTLTGELETVGDRDWYRISLTAGQSISVALDILTLEDPYLRIYDGNGNLLFENDDIVSGVERGSLVAFTATYSGTYYIGVGAWEDNYSGSYELSVSAYSPPPIGTVSELADQLVNGYWGGDAHHFNVTPGGSITVNLTALTAAGQSLATYALSEWTKIIGVNFVQVSTGGQIIFDDNEEGAFSTGVWSEGIISSARVNVEAQWLSDYGTSRTGYSFQTYLHEIGHALGLGHQGNYNGDARYPFDAIYGNDSWAVSVMSYFGQTENSIIAEEGYNQAYIITPMMADILAMSMLYGLSTTTGLGDSTYGYSGVNAYCIFDVGGTDTISALSWGGAQLINLNAGTFSNLNGYVGNVSIAFGVTIENAVGSTGNDTIIANAANNVLSGGEGEDTLSYETATAAVRVDLNLTAQQDTIGAGLDTLSGFERLTGSAFNDTLTGSSASTEIRGGDGNDRIISTGLGYQYLYGDNGDDWFVPGQGNDQINGGNGFDTVDYSGATGSIDATTNNLLGTSGSSGFDGLDYVEQIIGSNFNDVLWAFWVGDQVSGGGGDDTLKGSSRGASQLYGGAGNDTYEVLNYANQVIETAGEGIDHVVALANFTLGANVENLTLLQPVYDPHAGAAPNYDRPFADFYGAGNDLANVITGNAGANLLSGLGGADTLNGGDGDDVLDGGTGSDVLSGGAGNDRIVYDSADVWAQVSGGAGTDVLVVRNMTAPGFSLIAQGFESAEVTQTDTGANPWSTIFETYNANWGLIRQTTTNDDGSRLVVDGDPNNVALTRQVWSSYDAQGRLSSVDQLFDNGTRTFVNADEAGTNPWVQNWFNYDVQGRLDSQDVLYDNGTRTFINFDEAGTQDFAQNWFVYDVQGRLDSQDVLYDNGTRTFINFDETGTQPFAQNWFNYDAQGRLDSQDVLWDDGTHTFINFDQDNSQPWSQAWFTYDAQGRLDTQDVINDGDGHIFYNYDQTNAEAFAYVAIFYNAAGNAYQQLTASDNGTNSYTYF